ncbi:MAG: nucleotidyltransferase substrate binding protein [Candidatus Margulisiibacteriota bacterium]|jgi:nucleotidyltransferase substrate binding protein (TIGR01987 family)
MLDFSSLNKALNSLKKGYQRAINNRDDEELRDAVIQRFEYTFELSYKMLKRQLELTVAIPEKIDSLSFRELLREGAEKSYIKNVEEWFFYRELRNMTSHTYDEDKAEHVFDNIESFIIAAEDLLNNLTRNHSV